MVINAVPGEAYFKQHGTPVARFAVLFAQMAQVPHIDVKPIVKNAFAWKPPIIRNA